MAGTRRKRGWKERMEEREKRVQGRTDFEQKLRTQFDGSVTVSLKGTMYRVTRFKDATYGIRRGTHWVMYRNGTMSEVLKRARAEFAESDVKAVMKE